jgi:hypothetical protein
MREEMSVKGGWFSEGVEAALSTLRKKLVFGV